MVFAKCVQKMNAIAALFSKLCPIYTPKKSGVLHFLCDKKIVLLFKALILTIYPVRKPLCVLLLYFVKCLLILYYISLTITHLGVDLFTTEDLGVYELKSVRKIMLLKKMHSGY